MKTPSIKSYVSILGALFITLSLPYTAHATVLLGSMTSPSSGGSGVNTVTLTASGFPAGNLGEQYMTVWLASSCGTSGATTTVPSSITSTGGGNYNIAFLIPKHLLTASFQVYLSGSTVPTSTSPGTNFVSGNCSTISVTGTLPTPIIDVTQAPYNADPTGSTDSTMAIQNAITYAQYTNLGGTVYLPAGTYKVGTNNTHCTQLQKKDTSVHPNVTYNVNVCDSLIIQQADPNVNPGRITLAGAGMNATKIVETIGCPNGVFDCPTSANLTPNENDILLIKEETTGSNVDGTVVQDIEFDTATNNARSGIAINANQVVLERVYMNNGNQTFSVFFAGPTGATKDWLPSQYAQDNKMLDSKITDSVTDDSLSFSYQNNGVIRNIIHTGSRLAVYVDANLTVADYQYTPGTQPTAKDGYYITPPSSNITMRNFVSSGNGGVFGTNNFTKGNYYSSNISVVEEQMTAGGHTMTIGDVQSLSITSSTIKGSMNFDPLSTTNSSPGITVGTTTLDAVTFNLPSTASLNGLMFTSNTYNSFTPAGYTFSTTGANMGTISLTASGLFCNTGGFATGTGLSATNDTTTSGCP